MVPEHNLSIEYWHHYSKTWQRYMQGHDYPAMRKEYQYAVDSSPTNSYRLRDNARMETLRTDIGTVYKPEGLNAS